MNIATHFCHRKLVTINLSKHLSIQNFITIIKRFQNKIRFSKYIRFDNFIIDTTTF